MSNVDYLQAVSSSSNDRLYNIDLQRGARGFGFSIRGGREFNNMPLFILKIADGGSAHADGRLRVQLICCFFVLCLVDLMKDGLNEKWTSTNTWLYLFVTNC